MLRLPGRKWLLLGILSFAIVSVWWAASSYYSLLFILVPEKAARVLLSPVSEWIYRDDLTRRDQIIKRYLIGRSDLVFRPMLDSWRSIERSGAGITVISADQPVTPTIAVPFVYENPNAGYLKEFRDRYELGDIVKGKSSEYEEMLALGAWLGTRWDHGTDPVVGTTQICDPSAVVSAGVAGARYWCEIAARTTVHAFVSLGWSARVITASRDGYTWEHALAEVWSNQFNKWFILDTDFNVVFESNGVPLSAFELMRDGNALQHTGQLRQRRIAPQKPNLPDKDLIPFFRYVHVDLRNDWCSRHLSRGSPAGGDLSTWWASRPDMPHLLTAKIRIDDQSLFDWKLNSVAIHGLSADWYEPDQVAIKVALTTYSPLFEAFEIRIDDQQWARINAVHSLLLREGLHELTARVVTVSGHAGPLWRMKLLVKRPPSAAGKAQNPYAWCRDACLGTRNA